MDFSLPQEYIIQKFYQYAGYPKYNKHAGTYSAGCPVCREGDSWGKKRRLYYILKEESFYCQNCQKGWKPINWIQLVGNMSFAEVMREASDYELIPIKEEKIEKRQTPTLPIDSINLCDVQQVQYWQHEQVIKDALAFIKNRKLDIAANAPKSLWISLKDPVHRNRIVLPFYDENNNITFYQTRAIYKEDADRSKYLSKTGAEKTVFNLQNLDSTRENVFVFEGPIDSCFVKNGVAVAGITMTESQESELERYRFLNKIWVLDNQFIDATSMRKTTELIDRGEKVFIWPEQFRQFKDFNEICQKYNLGELSPRFITDNAFEGLSAKLALKTF